jgi:hypothetical protein
LRHRALEDERVHGQRIELLVGGQLVGGDAVDLESSSLPG